MNRIVEKVKDIVDVRSHVPLINFSDDPLRTLTGYHFTDVTSMLMSKWLSRVSKVGASGGGAAALAGFRGVGKSHFMATFGTILGHMDLRSRVTDQLILSSLQSISQRRFQIANVKRGTRESLFEELKDAVAHFMGSEPSSLPGTMAEVLARAQECVGDSVLVILIDTSSERMERVARDDGPVLAEMAEIARSVGAFIGVALDDDISNAEGANSVIMSSFEVDYLDQEHLYKIVDTYIFPKQNHKQDLLFEIYDHYHEAIPKFRWSKERFVSLYPLHPAIIECAPFVRLYLQDFALLSFASEAGARILGRPANSLIALDEVFDNVEAGLRRVEMLKEAFSVYDRLNTEVIAKTAVTERLKAKLVLKGLFLHSLNDEGATAPEIAASMLIYEEGAPEAGTAAVEGYLSRFERALPDHIRVSRRAGSSDRYCLRLEGKDELKLAIEEAAKIVPESAANDALRSIINEKYSDCSFARLTNYPGASGTDCVIKWRGGLRPGMVVWPEGTFDPSKIETSEIDWVTVIDPGNSDAKDLFRIDDVAVAVWTPSPLTEDEIDTLRRYQILQSDHELKTTFREHISAAVQANTAAVERVFQRAFLTDGTLTIDGLEYNFTEEAQAAPTLSIVFTTMLESLFEGRFPMHPYFPEIISIKDVSSLVSDLFGGGRPRVDEVQRLAARFGEPMGIVSRTGAELHPTEAQVLRDLPIVKLVTDSVDKHGAELVPLRDIFSRLGTEPYGLVKEGSYLLLSAMVAAHLIEFVTLHGDRINNRSLDLKIVWGDIAGVAFPVESAYSGDRLLMWAAMLTGRQDVGSFQDDASRNEVSTKLGAWLEHWRERKFESRFDQVRDERLNSRVWRKANRAAKVFRSAAESITAHFENSLSLEHCLQRIADAFYDSEMEFLKFSSDLEEVEAFMTRSTMMDEIAPYLSLCELTGRSEIDELRSNLYQALNSPPEPLTVAANIDLENLWTRFLRQYIDHYVEQHDAVVMGPYLREKLAEILATDVWWEFEKLSEIRTFDARHRSDVHRLISRIRNFDCRVDTRGALSSVPNCSCSFSLTESAAIESLPKMLWDRVNGGLAHYRHSLRSRRGEFAEALAKVAGKTTKGNANNHEELIEYIASGKVLRRLSEEEIRMIHDACELMGKKPTARSATDDDVEFYEIDAENMPEFAELADPNSVTIDAGLQ